jgi:hypothetical protein
MPLVREPSTRAQECAHFLLTTEKEKSRENQTQKGYIRIAKEE